MRLNIKRELTTFSMYFVIAFAAEIGGFVGWINEIERGGDMFQVSAAFTAHEGARLPMWLLVFLALGLARLLIMLMMNRLEAKGMKQT